MAYNYIILHANLIARQVFIACFLAVALAAPAPEDILNYDAEDHKHSQTGEAGNTVKGTYRYKEIRKIQKFQN